MKKFLQLFVLSVLSLVAVSMKAQTYNGGVWYSLYDETERTLWTSTWWQDKEIYNYTGLFTPSTGVLTFDTKMTKNVGITDPDDYELTVNGNTLSVPDKQTSFMLTQTFILITVLLYFKSLSQSGI
jgi:hypothetical protein